MADSSSDVDRESTSPRASRIPPSFRTNERSSGLRGVGLLVGGGLFGVGISIYTADSYGLFEAATVLLFASIIVAVSFPYYAFRDEGRNVYVVNTGDERAAFDVRLTPDGGALDRIDHRVELDPDEGTVLEVELETETAYTIDVAVDGAERTATRTVPATAATVDDDSSVFAVEVGSSDVRTARYAADETNG
jgi:hypothetical protein